VQKIKKRIPEATRNRNEACMALRLNNSISGGTGFKDGDDEGRRRMDCVIKKKSAEVQLLHYAAAISQRVITA